MGGDGDDSDYEPASDHEVGDAAEKNNRKRRRNQERGHASSRVAAPPAAPAIGVADEEKKRIASLRCSPSKFKEIVAALSDNLKSQPHYLDRQLLSWLMRKLNPETMKLEIGGGKEIAITEHTVWCVFQIPNSGSDPPFMTDDEARLKWRELGVQLCGHAYNPKVGIRISDLVDGFKKRTLTGALGLRAFFMCTFQSLLFSNTDSYIRIEDVKNTEDVDNIGRRNWCKAVVDNLRKAARLYKKDFAEKGIHAPITGCANTRDEDASTNVAPSAKLWCSWKRASSLTEPAIAHCCDRPYQGRRCCNICFSHIFCSIFTHAECAIHFDHFLQFVFFFLHIERIELKTDLHMPLRESSKETAGDGLGDAQNQGQPIAEDTPQTDDVLCEHANDDIAKLNSSAFGEAGPSVAASDPMFPEDPIDEINS
ncbi:uncharacterized protein C2845_PM01G43340 [Panicum miliaceum]|uniref:Uncharacterized protein n=1 Tax=Panicum miliaceum TaxID=4540 RepID=A0A3L6TSL5_PANMI|nr:uncharacterized protein C2845_PM01G43340 [Panicum miliaceum]